MRGEQQVLYSQQTQIVNALEDRKPKMQWCLCPLNSEDFTGDIFLPDQGEVNIGRAILGVKNFWSDALQWHLSFITRFSLLIVINYNSSAQINDRKISRNHLGIRIQDRELSIKLVSLLSTLFLFFLSQFIHSPVSVTVHSKSVLVSVSLPRVWQTLFTWHTPRTVCLCLFQGNPGFLTGCKMSRIFLAPPFFSCTRIHVMWSELDSPYPRRFPLIVSSD